METSQFWRVRPSWLIWSKSSTCPSTGLEGARWLLALAFMSTFIGITCTSERAPRRFFKTYFAAEIENPDVDAELQVVEDSLKYVEAHFLDSRKFIGGDEISIADLQFASEIFQNQHGRLVHDLFDFPKSAAVVQAVRSLPNNAFNIVFKEQMDFNQSLPPVKSAQVTIRGNREVLKGLQKARPKRQNTFLIDKWVSQNFSSEQDQHDVVSQIHREQPN